MGNWDNMMALRGHDEFYDMEDLHKAFEDGRKQGWREAMEEAQHSGYAQRGGYGQREEFEPRDMGYGMRDGGSQSGGGSYGQRENYPPQGGGFDPNAYGQRRGVKGTGPYSRMR